MDRRDYDIGSGSGEGSSLVIGVLIMVVVSSAVGVAIIAGTPLGTDSSLGPTAQIQPVTGGIEITAETLEPASHLLVLCGNSTFTLAEGETGILYEPACQTVTVNAVTAGAREVIGTYEPVTVEQEQMIVVAGDGSGDVRTLSAALNRATTDDMIILRNTGEDTRYSGSVTVTQPVSIRGDTGVTVVTNPDSPLRLASAGATLEHLHVSGVTETPADVLMLATERVVMTDVTVDVDGSGAGIVVADAAGRNQLTDISVLGTGTGVLIDNSTTEIHALRTTTSLAVGMQILAGPSVGYIDLFESTIAGHTGLQIESPQGTAMDVRIEDSQLSGGTVALDLSNINDGSVSVDKSAIVGSKTGVLLGTPSSPVIGPISVSQSTMSVNLSIPVDVRDAGEEVVVVFTENWWGDTNGPPETLKTTGNASVDVSPWCTDKACSTLS
jgi:hypothetical protein